MNGWLGDRLLRSYTVNAGDGVATMTARADDTRTSLGYIACLSHFIAKSCDEHARSKYNINEWL